MTFIKCLKRTDETKQSLQKRRERGQSVLEYSLLVAVAIIALLATNFLITRFHQPGNAFERFFNTTRSYIAGN